MSPQQLNSKEVSFFRAGFKNSTNFKEGLKSKDRLSLNKESDADAESKIQDILSEAKENQEVKEMTVYVRRRHFPILPYTCVSKMEKKQTTTSSNDEGEEKTTTTTTSSSSSLPLQDATKDFNDVLNVILLDEPLPEFQKYEAQHDTVNNDEYDLPEGARIVGDRVIIPARAGLFGGMTEETSVPLSFYKRKGAPQPGGGLFGQPQPGGLFGQPQPGGLFAAPGSSLFGQPQQPSLFGIQQQQQQQQPFGGGGFSFGGPSAPTGFTFGAATNSEEPSNLFANFKPAKVATKQAAVTKKIAVKAAAPTSSLFGAPSAPPSFDFKF